MIRWLRRKAHERRRRKIREGRPGRIAEVLEARLNLECAKELGVEDLDLYTERLRVAQANLDWEDLAELVWMPWD